MAKSVSGGAMNKHNARQNIHNKPKYEYQKIRTARNKQRHIDAQARY